MQESVKLTWISEGLNRFGYLTECPKYFWWISKGQLNWLECQKGFDFEKKEHRPLHGGEDNFRKKIAFIVACIFWMFFHHLCRVSVRNSSRVFGSSRNVPSMQLVMVEEPGFCTPLITIHMWLNGWWKEE